MQLFSFNVSELDPIKSELESQWMTDYSGGDEKFWSHEYCKHGRNYQLSELSPIKILTLTLNIGNSDQW